MIFINNDDKAETQEEVVLHVANDAFVVVELMQIVLSDEAFKASLGVCVDMLPSIIHVN